MTPDLATATARIRQHLTRRRFLGGISASTVGTYLAMRGAEEAAIRGIETVAGQLLADPEPVMPPRHLRRVLDRREFDRLASAGQRALVDGIAVNGLATVPDAVAGRLTVLEEVDHAMWVRHQCAEASRLLFRERPRVGIPMTEQPDRAFAIWREGFLRVAATAPEPTFELVRPIVAGRPLRYTTVAATVRGRLYVVSADEPPATSQPAPRSTRPTTGLAAA